MFEEDMMQEEWNGFHKTDFAHTHTHINQIKPVFGHKEFFASRTSTELS